MSGLPGLGYAADMKVARALFLVGVSWSQLTLAAESKCMVVEPNGTVVASFPYEKDDDRVRASNNLDACILTAMKEAAKLCEADSTKTYIVFTTRFICADKSKVAKLVAEKEKRIADTAAKSAAKKGKKAP